MIVPRDDTGLHQPHTKLGISEYWAWLGLALLFFIFLPWRPPVRYTHIWWMGYVIAATMAAVTATTLVELSRRRRSLTKSGNATAPYPYAPLTLRSLFKAVLALSIIFALITASHANPRGKAFLMLLSSLAVVGYYVCGQLVRWLSPRPQLPK